MKSIHEFIEELEMSIENCEPGSLRPETVFRELPWWDSLAVLVTLAAFDSCFNRQISAADLAPCRTLADVYALAAR